MSLVATKRQPPKKVNAVITVKKQPATRIKIESEPAIQQFFPTHLENSVSVQFKNCIFGIQLQDKKPISFMRNNEAKDNTLILEICRVIKSYIKNGLSFEQIAEKLMCGSTAASIRIFLNTLNKPVPTE